MKALFYFDYGDQPPDPDDPRWLFEELSRKFSEECSLERPLPAAPFDTASMALIWSSKQYMYVFKLDRFYRIFFWSISYWRGISIDEIRSILRSSLTLSEVLLGRLP